MMSHHERGCWFGVSLLMPSLLVTFPQTYSVFCRASEGVMTHLVESIEETPFLNRSVEAFFAEGLEVRNVPWAVSRRKSMQCEVAH